ncbi:MAG TPA: hypothetical protein VK700_09380 [Steroidobacteraceae bacterium]|jgi:hypothetical protein|nr:hypothetical protein [Steroidobacteraceae bacterium]
MAVAAFWLAVTAFIVVGALNARRGYELKFETIRLMMEKGQKIDDALLRDLLTPPKWHSPPAGPVGQGYRTMRIFGTLALFIAPGLSLVLGLAGAYGGNPAVSAGGIAAGALLALLGIGLFAASRYLPRPPSDGGTGLPKA